MCYENIVDITFLVPFMLDILNSCKILGKLKHDKKKMIGFCYDPNVPHWLSVSLTMCLSFWVPSHCKPVFKDKFYPWVCNIWYQSQPPLRVMGVAH